MKEVSNNPDIITPKKGKKVMMDFQKSPDVKQDIGEGVKG